MILKQDLISVIIPIYKVEKYLDECLYSIVNQTYENLEILLVDDGSPDNCGKICDEYAQKDNRIKVIHKENGGLSSARNAGLDIAKGEYISFVDSDDVIDEKFIETLYKMCINNSVDIAICDYMRFTDTIEKDKSENTINVYSSKKVQNDMYENIISEKVVVTWNKLYKKYLFEEIRFPVGKIHEDEFTTYKLLYASKSDIAVTNSKFYYYRCNPNGIMGRKYNKNRLDILEALEERTRFYKGKNEEDLYKKSLINYSEFLRSTYLMAYLYIEKDKKEILKRIIQKNNIILSEILKCKSISFKVKLKIIIFKINPNLYVIKNKSKYEE